MKMAAKRKMKNKKTKNPVKKKKLKYNEGN